MRLRDDSVYLKLSTYHDLVWDGTHAEILERLHEWSGRPLTEFVNLGNRGRSRPVTPQLIMDELHSHVGGQIHQPLHVRLSGTESAIRTYEFRAGAHPYTGRFVTQVDIRIDRGWVARVERAASVIRRRFVSLVELTHPFLAHAHDTDDNTIQNTSSPGLIRRGFDVEVPDDWDPANNPGFEINRGQYRYAINWLTVFGPELVAHLGDELFTEPPVVGERLEIDPASRKLPEEEVAERLGGQGRFADMADPAWWLFSLGSSPLTIDDDFRQRQAALRDHFALDERAESEKYTWGYWQRR